MPPAAPSCPAPSGSAVSSTSRRTPFTTPPTPPSASASAPSCGGSGTPPRCRPRSRNSTAWSPPTVARQTASPTGSNTTSPKASPSSPCRSRTGGACVPPTPSSGRSSRRSNAAPARSASSPTAMPCSASPPPSSSKSTRTGQPRTASISTGTAHMPDRAPTSKFQTSGCSIVNYVSGPADAEAVVEEVRHCGGSNSYAHRCDVSNEDDVRQMFDRMRREFGTIDILVNNAGLQQDAPFEEMTLAQWNKVIAVNLTGQFLCAREAVREFKRRGVQPAVSCSAGKIIFVSSVQDVIPWAGHVNYAASKGGVSLMMKSIAQEVAPWRIRVNAVSPGAIRTPINMQAWSTPEAYAELMKLVPYKRIGVSRISPTPRSGSLP